MNKSIMLLMIYIFLCLFVSTHASFAIDNLRPELSQVLTRAMDEAMHSANASGDPVVKRKCLSLYSDVSEEVNIGRNHVERVAEEAVLFAVQGQSINGLALTSGQVDILWKAALLHDIGREGRDSDLRRRSREFAKKYKLQIFFYSKHDFLRRYSADESNIVNTYIEVAVNNIQQAFGSLENEVDREQFITDAEQSGITVERTPSGANFNFSPALRRNLEIYLCHEARSAQMARDLGQSLGFEPANEMFAIIACHDDPQKVPVDAPAWVKLATEYLYAADNFETRCNEAKQKRLDQDNQWHEVILYDAMPILQRRVDQGMIRDGLYAIVEDLVENRNLDLIKLSGQAMQRLDLPGDDYDKQIDFLRRVRKLAVGRSALVAGKEEVITHPIIRMLTAMGFKSIYTAETPDEANRILETNHIDLFIDKSSTTDFTVFKNRLPTAYLYLTDMPKEQLRQLIEQWL